MSMKSKGGLELNMSGTYHLDNKTHLIGYWDHDTQSLKIQIANLKRDRGRMAWCHSPYDTVNTDKPSQAWVKYCKKFGYIRQPKG